MENHTVKGAFPSSGSFHGVFLFGFFVFFFGFFATTKEIVLTGSAHFWKVVQLFGD